MKTYTGIVTRQEIKKNRDGDQNVRMLQVVITEPDDVQEIQQVTWTGDDTAPVDGDMVVIIEISESYKIAVAIQGQIDPTVGTGERKIYSQSGGIIKAFAYFKDDGQINLNGTGDYLVRYNELKTAFDQLKTDLDALKDLYNGHIHITTATIAATPTPGVISATVSQGSPSTADMTAAKVDTVEVPK